MAFRRSHDHRSGYDSQAIHVPELDWMVLAVMALCCLGLVMNVSVRGISEAGPVLAMQSHGAKLLVGVIAFLVCAVAPLDRLRRLALPLFVVGLVLCLATHFMGGGIKGAARWIRFGGFQFQPVEFARFAFVFLIADQLARAGELVRTVRHGLLPVAVASVVFVGALLLQPDHGNAAFVLLIAGFLALVAGVPVRHFALAAAPVLVGFVFLALQRGYVRDRLTGFLDVRPDTQVGQSLTAIAGGGLTGQGLGDGWMKMGYVPEAKNDFMFAIIGEELGFLGGLFVLVAFTAIGWAGYRLAATTHDPFRRRLILGFVLVLCVQAAINLVVTCGLAPAKGIDLPFVSAGGTSLVFCLAAVGIMGNAARSDINDP